MMGWKVEEREKDEVFVGWRPEGDIVEEAVEDSADSFVARGSISCQLVASQR